MPVYLTWPDEVDRWLMAPIAGALAMQRLLAGGTLRIVSRGAEKD